MFECLTDVGFRWWWFDHLMLTVLERLTKNFVHQILHAATYKCDLSFVVDRDMCFV